MFGYMMNSICNKIAALAVFTLLSGSLAICQDPQSAGLTGDERGVAVLPFETRGLAPDEGMRLKERFSEALGESKRFEIMPDDAMKSMLAHVGLTHIDSCNTVACIAQLGKILHVEKVVHVSADRWDDRYILHVRLVKAADAELLYDERIDFTGTFDDFLNGVTTEQGRKLSHAFLDTPPNWYLIAACVLIGVGVIYWIYSTWATSSSSESGGIRTNPTPQ
jgi:TolB-like protein